MRTRTFGLAALLLSWWLAGVAQAVDLAEVKAKGMLRVAVYKDFAPFNDGGRGIDADLAQALAEKLGVKASLLPFDADENVDDDLRNMVWKGHYLGYGPADVMMHVPVDRPFMERNKKVRIFAPYFREKVQLARDLKRLPELAALDVFRTEPIGVEGSTLASVILIGADGGRIRENVRHFKSTFLAIDELKAGRLAAVMGLRSELESGVQGSSHIGISDPQVAGMPPNGWVLGLAVKAEYEELARALQAAMNELDAEGRLAGIFKKHGVTRLAP